MIPAVYTRLAALGAALAMGAAGAWYVQAWRYDAQLAALKARHAQTLSTISDKTAAALDAVRAYERGVQIQLADKDTQHHQELTRAKTDTDRLRACVRAGTCGVRIVTAAAPGTHACTGPQDAAASGVGNGALALDAAAAERVLDLRESVESDRIKLDYLQGYANSCYAAGIDAQRLSGQAQRQ